LASPKSPRNFLVTAPAGRGKTALLVRWASQADPAWPLAFVPISIRYETNRADVFYQALAAHLASLLGESLPPTPSDPASFYKEKVIEYFDKFEQSDRRCLVVIDGLDEASGWQVDTTVLPIEPPANVRILASARQLAGDRGASDWLRKLGWAPPRGNAGSMEVPPLTRDGIGEVLVNMGFPIGHLAKDVDIVGELFRLTGGGDPLLVELYVNDLWARGEAVARLRPDDLAKCKPGFGAYFRDWFDQQKRTWRDTGLRVDEGTLDAILALLSCAIGPIRLAELDPLLARMLDERRHISRDTLKPIDRFVIGDGVDTGFALGHPKLADFIQDDYFGGATIVDDARAAYVQWGRQVVADLNAAAIEPKEAPDYCLLYYVQHLERQPRLRSLEDYRALADNGWRLAWTAHDEGLRGFARDVEVALGRLREAGARDPAQLRQPRTGIGGQIRCLLCLSSIRSIGASVPPHFLAELVRLRLIAPKQALHFARLKPEPEQARTLEALAPQLGTVVSEALVDARNLSEPDVRAGVLAALAPLLPAAERADLLAEARALAALPKEEYKQKSALAKIERAEKGSSAEETQVSQAHAAAETDTPSESRDFAEPEAEEVERTVVQALADPDGMQAYLYLPAVAQWMTDAQFAEVLTWLAKGNALTWRRDLLKGLAPLVPAAQRDRALDLAISWDGYDRAGALEGLIPWLSDDQWFRVFESARTWSDTYYQSETYEDLFRRPLSPILFAAAQDTLIAVHPIYRNKVIDAMAPTLSPEQAAEIIALLKRPGVRDPGEGLAALLATPSPDVRARLVREILTLPEPARRDALIPMARSASLDVLREVATAVSDRIGDLDILLPRLPLEEREALVGRTFRSGLKIRDGVALTAALTALARSLPREQAAEAMNLAAAAARENTDDTERGFACLLASCSSVLSPEDARALLEEAVASASKIPDAESQLFLKCATALSPSATTAEADEIARDLIQSARQGEPPHATPPTTPLAHGLLLLSQRLSDDAWQAAAGPFEVMLDSKEVPERFRCVLRIMAGLIPRQPPERAAALIAAGEAGLAKEEPDTQLMGRVLLALSSRITRKDAERHVEALLSFSADDMLYGQVLLMPYLPEARARTSIDAALKASMKEARADLLGILAMTEGNWYELLGFSPALAGGEPPRSCLLTIGGPPAVSETYQAIRDIHTWWP